MGAGIPADGTRSDNGYLPTHAFLPALLATQRLPRRPGSSQQLNSVAARCPMKKILMRPPAQRGGVIVRNARRTLGSGGRPG
jgi:hypothetical protein